MAGSNEKLRVLRRIPELRFEEELRGYNKHQVDRVLENLAPLADEVDALLERLGEAERRAATAEARLMEHGGPPPSDAPPATPPADFDETLRNTLLLAQRTADTTVAEAKEEAARLVADATTESAGLRADADAAVAGLRADAEAEHAAALARASDEALAMVESARATIDERVAQAEEELRDAHEETRTALVDEIAALRDQRDRLAADVDRFEGHLAARREAVREAIAEIAEVIDDPERLRTTMPPTPVGVDDALTSASVPITVPVTALDGLDAEVASVPSPDVADDPDPLAVTPPAGADTVADGADTDADPEADLTWADDVDGDVDDAPDDLPSDAVPPSETMELDPVDGGPPTEALPAVDLRDDDTDVAAAAADEAASRPAWADAVPAADQEIIEDPAGTDPFLDELRRVTTEDDDDEQLASFLSDGEGEERGGWFGRRR